MGLCDSVVLGGVEDKFRWGVAECSIWSKWPGDRFRRERFGSVVSGDELSGGVGGLILLEGAGYGCFWDDNRGGSFDCSDSSTSDSCRGDGGGEFWN